jgi:hypothetical protein
MKRGVSGRFGVGFGRFKGIWSDKRKTVFWF